MNSILIILILRLAVANGKYQYEGLRYDIDSEITDKDKQVYLKYPEKLMNCPVTLNNIVWSIDDDEKPRCACPAENQFVENLLDWDEYFLFPVDRENCECKKKVKHSIIDGYEGESYELYYIVFKLYRENKAEITHQDEKDIISTISFSMDYTALRIMSICLFKDGDRFVSYRVSKLIEPKNPSLNLDKFDAASFEESQSLKPYFKKKNQIKVFRELMNEYTANELEQHNIYLIPQQLAREELMILNHEKPATLYNFNVVPIWNNIADDWNHIQNKIIKRSAEEEPSDNPMKIISGTHGSFRCYKEEKIISLYLIRNYNQSVKINVPFYYWNLYFVRRESSEKQELLFLIMHNDYHYRTTGKSQQEKLCEKSVCEDFSIFDKIDTKKRGILVYCCLASTNNREILRTLQLEEFVDENYAFLFKPAQHYTESKNDATSGRQAIESDSNRNTNYEDTKDGNNPLDDITLIFQESSGK